MKFVLKGALVLGSLAPVFAFGQAEATVKEVAYEAGGWQTVGYYDQQSTGSVGQTLWTDSATANMATHSFTVQAGADTTAIAALGEFGHFGSGQAVIQDTITFNQAGIVRFGSLVSSVLQVAGNCDGGIGMEVAVTGGGNTYSDTDSDTGTGGGFDQAPTYSPQSNLYDMDGFTHTDSWVSNLGVTFLAQAGVSYLLTSNAIASTMVQTYDAQLEIPTADFYGYAQVDPSWYLTTSPGMTYTTGSGYAISPLATPEPSSMAPLGLGFLALFVRRRSSSR